MGDREQYTLRLPSELMAEARQQASAYGKTVNDVSVEAIASRCGAGGPSVCWRRPGCCESASRPRAACSRIRRPSPARCERAGPVTAPMPEACLDTSVWVKRWLPEQGSDTAHDLMVALLERNWGLIAPPTLAYQMASVLRVKVRRGILTANDAEAVWRAFRAYPLLVEAATDLPDRAWALTLRLPTAYDAACLAAAGTRPLVTADRALLDACRGDATVRVVDLTVARATLFGAE